MAAEETVFSVYPCVNCNTFNNSNNDLCAKCGVFLHGDKKLCSNCKNPLSVDKEKCDYCDFTIKEKITVFVNFKNFYKKEKERFIDIIYGKRSRENIMNEYGLKGFDTFTGFIDWELFDLFEIVDEELKYLPTAKYILSDNASELFLSKYGLTKEYNIEEKIRKTVENLNKKVNSGEFLQSFPEVGISFSLVAEVYNKYFDFEHRDFNNWEQEELARNLLRALVNFYSSLLQNSNVLDEENVIDRKLILFSTILFDITFCIELSDSLSNKQYYECEHIINERLMRSSLFYNFYRINKELKEDKTMFRNLCREIIADLGGALYLQWRVKGKDVKPIFELYANKLSEFAEEGIALHYFTILESFFRDIHYMYEGVGPFPWGESKDAVPFFIRALNILNRLEEKEEESSRTIGTLIRAYDFYRSNIEYIAIEMMKDKRIMQIVLKFLDKYYIINTKVEKKEGIRKEVEAIVEYIEDEKKRDMLWEYTESNLEN